MLHEMGNLMKKETGKADIKLRSSQMTLKPKKKIRRKNKTTNLQTLYNEGKVTTQEFYEELTKFIKWRLMPDLIKRGYYINGVKQNNFTRDECDACYTHVLHKIINEYSPEKGTLATYIRWQIRGWGQLVIQKQVRTHKYIPNGTVSLDSNNIYNVKLEEYKERCNLPEDADEIIDDSCFGNSLLSNITQFDIDEIREGMKDFKDTIGGFEWLG